MSQSSTSDGGRSSCVLGRDMNPDIVFEPILLDDSGRLVHRVGRPPPHRQSNLPSGEIAHRMPCIPCHRHQDAHERAQVASLSLAKDSVRLLHPDVFPPHHPTAGRSFVEHLSLGSGWRLRLAGAPCHDARPPNALGFSRAWVRCAHSRVGCKPLLGRQHEWVRARAGTVRTGAAPFEARPAIVDDEIVPS